MRNVMISIFVIVWLIVFNYESTRLFYLERWVGHPLPKVKLLFPPAGWVMFYNIGRSYGHAEVYGIKGETVDVIDPHLILRTRAIGYDNINRNALVSVLSADAAQPFCGFLQRRFPHYDRFAVMYVNYPDVAERPWDKRYQLAYECPIRK